MKQVRKAYLLSTPATRVLSDSRGLIWNGTDWVSPDAPVVPVGEVYRSPYTVPVAWAGPVWWAR